MILLIDNYDSFTYNLVQRLGELDASLDIRVVRNDQITPDEAGALPRRDGGKGPERIIISPGPCTPKEAGVSSAIIERFAGRVPILGVCLGHQCMADLHGMTVTRHAVPMHGKTSPVRHDGRGVFAGLSDPFVATRYHSLVVLEETVPPLGTDGGGWQVSAWSDEPKDSKRPDGPTRRVVMGLRRVWSPAERAAGKTAPVEGVQFHPESFLTEEGPRLLANFLAMR
ncbi:MAG: aminodeoxychorismate/anthranilate synthase component II [Phycisphaeraceae bacterium]|nr:aminodeoxychorismate/anthranilate synthase component II [Phycisphaeraceae bacterium]